MELIFSIILGFVVAGIAFLIGTAVAPPVRETVAETQKRAKHTPMVVSTVFGQPPTKSFLVDAVLKPNEVLFLKHFAPEANLFDKHHYTHLDKKADEILRWYNPEYNELLLIAHPTGKLQDEGNQTFTVDFLWKKPTTPKPGVFLCPREAIEGMEEYYKDTISHLIAIGNEKE